MTIGRATLDALDRIAARANDVREAYRAGAEPLRGDVRAPQRFEPASDPLSVAAPPGAYFLTLDERGARTFTRDGGFRIEQGALVTAAGTPVLGFHGGDARGAVPVPLRLPEPDAALGRCGDVRLDGDGSLAYTRAAIDPRSGERALERVVAGRIALARFPAGTQPARIDATHAAAPASIVPHVGTPADGAFPSLATHARDTGNVDIEAGLRALSEAYLAFDALRAAQKANGSTAKTAMDLVK